MNRSAAVFHGIDKDFEIKEYPVLPPEKNMAGLKLVSSGVCGTDIHIHEGCLGMPDMPLIIGHEFIGTVDATGEDVTHDGLGNKLQKDDLVIACVAIPCGKCFNCRRGETASCLNFGVTYVKHAGEAPYFHGGFAEYLFSPAANLVKLPKEVDPFAAAAFPCGGPTVIRACEYGGGLEEGEIVAIQGNGSLGLFALAWAKAHGCRTVMIGSTANPERAEITKALQPDIFCDYRTLSEEETATRIRDMAASLGHGDGADVVIETSGSPKAVPFGLKLLRTRGRYLIPGQYSNRGAVPIEAHQITFRALRIIGSGQYTMSDIGTYLQFLARQKDLQQIFARMLTKYSITDINKAIADAKAGHTIKAVFAEK